MITILKIEFKPNDIAEVTFVNRKGMLEMAFVSMEFFNENVNIEKLKEAIDFNTQSDDKRE